MPQHSPHTTQGRGFARTHFLATSSDMRTILEPTNNQEGWVNSKVVATIGPSSCCVDTLEAMLKAGMSVARIDLTWGSLDYHKRALRNLQEAMKRSHKLCAIMVDTLGREVMIRRPFSQDSTGWPVHQECFTVLKDEEVKLITPSEASRPVTKEDETSQVRTATVTYEGLPRIVQPGDTIYVGRYLAGGAIEEGSLYLKVLSAKRGQEIMCRAENTAELCGLLTVFHLERSKHGIHNTQSDLPVLAQYDCDCLALLAEEFEIDFVCTSYTRSGDDVQKAGVFLDSIGLHETQIVAKIETRQGTLNFESILESASAIIVSRGVLGLDIAPEKMALVQKALVAGCNMCGKPVIITRVLDNMSDTPRPTRAEATDVANIVLDGADGILLGAETLRGRFPAEAIAMAVGICRQAEGVFDHGHHYDYLMEAAVHAVNEMPPTADAAHQHEAYMWQLDKMVEEGRLHPPALPSSSTSEREAISRPTVPKAGNISYTAHPSYSSAQDAMSVQQAQQQQAAIEEKGHSASPEDKPRLSRTTEEVLSRGAAEVQRVADQEHVALSVEAHPKRQGVGVQIRVPEEQQRPRRKGETAGQDLAMLPDGETLTPATPEDVLKKPSSRRSGTSTPGSKASRTPSASADLSSTLEAMISAGGHDSRPLPRRVPRVPDSQGSSTPRSDGEDGIPSGSLRQTDVVLGAPSDMPVSKADLDAAYHNLDSTFAMSSLPYMSKLESITSSAVRAAEKARASLILVFTHTSRAAQLVAKYRPPMPILTLVVPRLVSDGLHWRLEGKIHARQCLMTRGLLPMLSAPGPSGDQVLEEAVTTAARWGLVAAHQQVVVVERIHEHFAVKIVAVDELGLGIKKPASGAGAGMSTPARPAFGLQGYGAMTPQPMSRTMVASTPHASAARPSTIMDHASLRGHDGRLPAYPPAGIPFSSPSNTAGWLSGQQLQPTTSDASARNALYNAAAVQDLLPTPWGHHHMLSSQHGRKSEDKTAPPGIPAVAEGPPASPAAKTQSPFGSTTDLLLPPGTPKEAALGDADGVCKPGWPCNQLLAGAAPGNLLLPNEKIEAGVSDQSKGLQLSMPGVEPRQTQTLAQQRHPSLGDLLALNPAASTQEQDWREGGMRTRTHNVFVDPESTNRHPGTPRTLVEPSEPHAKAEGTNNTGQGPPSLRGKEKQDGSLPPLPSASLSPFLIPDPDASGSLPLMPSSGSNLTRSGSMFNDLGTALKGYESLSKGLPEGAAKADLKIEEEGPSVPHPREQIGTMPVVGMTGQQGGVSDSESLYNADIQGSQLGGLVVPEPGEASTQHSMGSFIFSPPKPGVQSGNYFEITPGYALEPSGVKEDVEAEQDVDPYADNFDNEKILAEESKAVVEHQTPPDEPSPSHVTEHPNMVEDLEQDARVVAPWIGSPGRPARSVPSTPKAPQQP